MAEERNIEDDQGQPASSAGWSEQFGDGRHREPFALYSLGAVETALGERVPDRSDAYEGDPDERETRDLDTEHLARLRAIARRGEAGRWRTLIGPRPDAVAALDELAARAPHMSGVAEIVRDHLRAALNIKMPLNLPALLVEGEPGIGKTWFMARLGKVLAVPHRTIALTSMSVGDPIVGSSPTWRNARGGIPSRMLLTERVANGLLVCDEFDKMGGNPYNIDPYRPFYAVLDPANSRDFVDEFYGFPMDASRLSWIFMVNDAGVLPAPIADRLIQVRVPEMSQAHRIAVATSIYDDANRARRAFFEPPSEALVDRLLELSPRGIRKALDEAMVRAAAQNRRRLVPDDVRMRAETRRPIGFGMRA